MTPPRPTLPSQAYSPSASFSAYSPTRRPTPPPRLLHRGCSNSPVAPRHACKAFWQAYATTTLTSEDRPTHGVKTRIHALSTAYRPTSLPIITVITLNSNFFNLEASFTSIPLHHQPSPRPTAPPPPPGLGAPPALLPQSPTPHRTFSRG